MDQIFCGVVLNDISPEDFVKKIIRNIKAALIKTLPSKNVAVELPYKLYFAKESRSWDGMGVAFIDLKHLGKTPGRAYLIN